MGQLFVASLELGSVPGDLVGLLSEGLLLLGECLLLFRHRELLGLLKVLMAGLFAFRKGSFGSLFDFLGQLESISCLQSFERLLGGPVAGAPGLFQSAHLLLE